MMHISALYANTNMDMKENRRDERISSLEEAYDSVVEGIKGQVAPEQQEKMTEQEAEFMSAAKRGQALIAPPAMPGEETISKMM